MSNLIIPFFANMGVQTTAPFTNTYSLSFDGVDDRVQLSSDFVASGEFTISFWMKPISAGTPNGEIYPIGTFPGNENYVKLDQIGVMWLRLGATTVIFNESVYGAGANNLVLNDWQNIVFIRDSSNVIRCYRNGADFGYNVAAATNSNTLTLNSFGRIITNTFGFEGGLDEIAFWNTDESANIATLSTAPTDLTSLAPVVWLRNGDNGSYKSPQWLLPSNENKDKVSNYSTQFDGIDDYFDLASSVDLGINNTISAWVKRSDILNLDSITGESSYSNGVGIYISSQQRVYMKIGSFITFWYNVSGFGILNQVDTWFHLAIVRQGNDATLYLNGSPTYVTSGWGTSITTKFDRIGAFALTGGNPMFGNLDEIAGFDSALTDLQINDIYNGGEPTTLPSGAVAHYKMGEEATFSGGVWTVPDSVGSNNGTSNAMTIEDRVGDAPNSENNALSYNMDEVDRVTDTP